MINLAWWQFLLCWFMVSWGGWLMLVLVIKYALTKKLPYVDGEMLANVANGIYKVKVKEDLPVEQGTGC